MKQQLKILAMKLMRIFVRFLYILPISPNRILFNSYIGEAYSCNPKYISEYLAEHYPGKYELVWAFKEPEKYSDIPNIKCIKYKSISWMLYEATSVVVVVNNGAVWIPRRSGQLIIDTWHGGGCYKRVALDDAGLSKVEKYRTALSSRETNLYLSSSAYFSQHVIRDSFRYCGKILNSGMPRNDLMFFPPSDRVCVALKSKLAKQYGFAEDDYVVLFAPTWRKSQKRKETIDANALKAVIEKKYKKNCVMLGRGHHTEDNLCDEGFLDVTAYPDMQELLLITDMLITDYSSSMWDFSFTGKPCLLYTPDLEEYTISPGFDCDIYTWGFPVCKTNDELLNAIEKFDNVKYLAAMKRHHKNLDNYEDGSACKQVADYIKNWLGGKEK